MHIVQITNKQTNRLQQQQQQPAITMFNLFLLLIYFSLSKISNAKETSSAAEDVNNTLNAIDIGCSIECSQQII